MEPRSHVYDFTTTLAKQPKF